MSCDSSASGHGASQSRSWPKTPHSSSAMCGAYGWMSDTAVSVAKRASGAPGAAEISLQSSITAEIGVWNWKRRSTSSVTRAIVSFAFRVSRPDSPVAGAAAATSCTSRQSRRRKRTIPSAPSGHPLHVLIRRAHEEDVEPHRIGPVRVDDLVRPLDVPLRLRHLRAAERDPALVEQPLERLAEVDHPPVVDRLHEEARVQEMPGRVVDAADVLRDRQPVVDDEAGRRAPRRCASRCSAGSTTTSRRTCPSCRGRAAPRRRTRGT